MHRPQAKWTSERFLTVSGLFGSALGADGEASKATTFDASAADSAALTEALGAAAEQSLGSPAGASDMKMKVIRMQLCTCLQ